MPRTPEADGGSYPGTVHPQRAQQDRVLISCKFRTSLLKIRANLTGLVPPRSHCSHCTLSLARPALSRPSSQIGLILRSPAWVPPGSLQDKTLPSDKAQAISGPVSPSSLGGLRGVGVRSGVSGAFSSLSVPAALSAVEFIADRMRAGGPQRGWIPPIGLGQIKWGKKKAVIK